MDGFYHFGKIKLKKILFKLINIHNQVDFKQQSTCRISKTEVKLFLLTVLFNNHTVNYHIL